MANLDEALKHLGFDRAPDDSVRAQLLLALGNFADSIGDKLLKEQTVARYPAANPFRAPKQWLAGFTEGFEQVADDDAGTDPEGGKWAGQMLWQMQSDEWRRARVADLHFQGVEDGEKEADGQNRAT